MTDSKSNTNNTVTLTVEEYRELMEKAEKADSEVEPCDTADQKKPKVKTGHLSSMINYSDRF